MTNAGIAAAFEKIGKILKLQDANPFRVRAYERAAQTIMTLTQDVAAMYQSGGMKKLREIPGIGEDLAAKIEAMVNTGKLKYLKDLEKKLPPGLLAITEIQGVGPKKTKFLWEKFKVKDIASLEKVAKSGKLTGLKGWGEKSVQNILLGIKAKKSHEGRVLLPIAMVMAEQLKASLEKSGLCDQLEIAGSLRRRKETIGDIDLLATSKKPKQVMEFFCALPEVERILGQGPTKASVRLKNGLNADVRVLDQEVFGAALHYFTGSKEHNVAIRALGNKKGLTISEYGVHRGTAEKKGKLLPSRTEEDIYKAIGLPYIVPELRENRGEIDAAQKAKPPHLIELTDIKGDLHLHSNFSDGSASMVEMARAAKEAGLQYIAITDHGSPMGMVRGIKEKNIRDYLKQIEDARKKVPGIHILAGTEVDILEDGRLYLSDDLLKQLDWVVAAIHGNFNLSREAQTKRLLRAIENPHVNLLAHPTARLLLKRDAIDYDMELVMRAAADHGVAMELNASIYRLDLNDVHCKRAKELGVKLCISSDAHHPREFDYCFGITQARRGWLEKKDVTNTMTWNKFERFLKR